MNFLQSLNNTLEEPKVKVELELTEEAMLRIIILAIIITIIVFSVSFIYNKLK